MRTAHMQIPSTQRTRGLAAVATTAVLVAVCVPAIAAQPEPSGHHERGALEAPQRWALNTGVAENLPSRGRPRVLVALRSDPLASAAADPQRRAAVQGRLSTQEVSELRRGGQDAGEHLSRVHERTRAEALDELAAAAARAGKVRAPLVAAIRRAGGQVLAEHTIGNAITATIPATTLARIARRGDVAAIEVAPSDRKHTIENSSAAVGAPAFWAAGYEGGAGASDSNPGDLAVIQDKIQQDHPLFQDQTFQTAPNVGTGTPCGSGPSDDCDHGTAVAAMGIASGAAGCSGCTPGDANQNGVAPAIDTVLDADGRTTCGGSIDNGAWALGIAHQVGNCPGTIPGSEDPAEVFSRSAGSAAPADDSVALRITDNQINVGGIASAISAGNEGPGQAVASPSIAYNTVSVGAFASQNTAAPADDVIPDFSSRGPTPGGRRKPDLVADGVPGAVANRRWFVSGQSLYRGGLEGTSFSAPQVAGGLTLLAGSGVTDPLAEKAILINSARQGRSSPAAAMGTQTGWQPDWGWGALDMAAALQEWTNFQSGSVPGGSARFYRTTLQGAGERASLVWARRTTGCIGPGCQPQGLTLSNLDLEQRVASTGALEASSTSGIDNVEQVRSPGAGTYPRQVVYKVKAASAVDGLPGEPFAVTSRRPLQALVTPQPTVELSRSASQVRQGDQVTLGATVRNPSPDLSAESASATLTLPAGVELVSGAASQSFGTLAPSGQASATWIVRGTSDGLKGLTAAAQASRYGETFQAAPQAADVLVDSTPPTVTIAGPGGQTTNTTADLAWGASDGGSGVASYDLERQVDGGAFETLAGGTGATSTRVSVPAGHRYRFRVRARDRLGNTSGYASSGELAVVAPVTPPPPGPGPPASKARSGLRVTKTTIKGNRLFVDGRIASRARGRVYAVYRTRLRGRPTTRKASAGQRRGRFRITVRLRGLERAHKGTLTLTHRGDSRYRRAQVRRSIKRAR